MHIIRKRKSNPKVTSFVSLVHNSAEKHFLPDEEWMELQLEQMRRQRQVAPGGVRRGAPEDAEATERGRRGDLAVDITL